MKSTDHSFRILVSITFVILVIAFVWFGSELKAESATKGLEDSKKLEIVQLFYARYAYYAVDSDTYIYAEQPNKHVFTADDYFGSKIVLEVSRPDRENPDITLTCYVDGKKEFVRDDNMIDYVDNRGCLKDNLNILDEFR